MSYSIRNVEADLEAILHGTSLNQITNLFGLFNRSARVVLADCDPNETMRFSDPLALHTGVYNYPCPDDLKGNRIFDIRPQVDRNPSQGVAQLYSKNFDQTKTLTLNGVTVNAKWDKYSRSLNISNNDQPVIMMNSCDTVTVNGTWTATGGATDLETDNLNFVEGSGSIRFDLPSNGGVENSTMAASDLSNLDPEGSIYFWIWVPDTVIDSVSVTVGSSSTDAWQWTVTTAQDGAAFQVGWNLCGVLISDASLVGSVDSSSITYMRFEFSQAPANPVRLDSVMASLGVEFVIGYYSKCLFRDAVTGDFQETVTADTNLLNLDTDSYNLFLYQCAIQACQQKQGIDALFADMPYFQNAYNDELERYQEKYPSQTQKAQTPYYAYNKQNYGKYVGRRFF